MKTQYKTTDRINKKVIKEILKVEKTQGLTAWTLLEQAKEKDNPLHDLFEWDNSVAAEKYRLVQARIIINEIKIMVEDKVMYGFENVTVKVSETDSKRVYQPINDIMDNEETRNQILLRGIQAQKYWKQQYSNLIEFKGIVKEIERVEGRLKKNGKRRNNTSKEARNRKNKSKNKR